MTRRTTIEIDDDVLAEVQAILGTKGLKDSVDTAFAELIRRKRMHDFIDKLSSGKLIELNPALRDEMWR